MGTSPYQIRAVERSLDILEAFLVRRPAMDLDTISDCCQLPKSTAFKILSVLKGRGYVQKDADDGKYRIGFQAYEVGNRYVAGLTVTEVVHPVLRDLAARFPGCSAHLASLAPTETEIVYLDIVSMNVILALVPVGSHYPAYSTALGKCLLAELPEPELSRRLAHVHMPQFTPQTIVDPQALREHLSLVRERGYAMDDEEMAPGNLCVGVPIRDRRGDAVAAISTSHVKAATTVDRATIISAMREAAQEINHSLGYLSSHPHLS